MVYTVTLNPSLDYIVTTDKFCVGTVNRTQNEELYPGGKGINVSIVLSRLGVKSSALGFLSGFVGEKIQSMLKEYNTDADFIFTDSGTSRINIKIKSEDETEINGRGPVITECDLQKLTDKLSVLNRDDVLILSGSIPPSISCDIYKRLAQTCAQKNAIAIVDTSGQALINTLPARPFLIKPNKDELSEIADCNLETEQDIINAAKKLQVLGAQNVLVSMGKDGAMLITQSGTVIKKSAPTGQVKNSVGAGDSMVAGFVAGFLKYKNLEMALCYGIAAGSASAFSFHLPQKEEIDALFKEVLL